MSQKSRCFRKVLSLFLTCVLFFSILPSHADAASSSGIIRVGLYHGSNAIPTANLANEIGSGYRFGYFDTGRQFHELGSTDVEKITICKDANLYLTANGGFYEAPPTAAYTLIGAYHLQAAGTYANYEQALTAAASYPFGFPAYINGSYVVRFEFYSSAANAAADAASYNGATVVGGSSSCYTVVNSLTGKILFEYDNGSTAYLGIMPSKTPNEAATTWFKGYQYYGGFQYMRRSGNDLTVVNFVNEDLYVSGVLPYEFVVSGSLESLKAGAVAIRTFARATTKHTSNGFDICNTTDCQVYRGVYTGAQASHALQAVNETAGECAYYDGTLIQALYFSSDGGYTEDSRNAWGGDYPYLTGKADPYEAKISFNGQSWSYHVTPAQLKTLLNNMGYSCSTITGLAVTATTANGNVNEIVITDSSGETFTFKRDNVRILQNISNVTYMSRRFTITPDGEALPGGNTEQFTVFDGNTTTASEQVTAITSSGNVTVTAPASVITGSGIQTIGTESASSGSVNTGTGDGWTITGGGYGHNVGMSQWGAYAMGKEGFTYDEILKFYYTGITIK